MVRELLPRDVKKAIERLEAEPERAWRLRDLAEACGVAPRTLQKHFHRFLGRSPLAHLRELRFDRARQELLRGVPQAGVTEIATLCGFVHFGRFASEYRRRFGESPSATLQRAQRTSLLPTRVLPTMMPALERPAIAIVPFEHDGSEPVRAMAFEDELAVALWRVHWVNISAPSHARYHLRGKVRDDGNRVRVTVRLTDVLSTRHVWAAAWDGDQHDPIGFAERVAIGIARAIQPALRAAEVARASRLERGDCTAWDLTMRALPCAASVEAAAEDKAIELLDEAMQLAPNDPLPISLAAWCHGLRAGHHFAARPEVEKAEARRLAARAAQLNSGDALTETMLASGYTLAHDLAAAAVHAERALALDGGSAWAWGRSGWVKAYSGRAAEAIEAFRIAISLAPADPLNFLWSIGIGSAEFQLGRFADSIRWFERGIAENPASTWIDRFRAPAYVCSGRMDEGRRTLAAFNAAYPGLTITDVRSGLPWNAIYLDRASEGLERLGMRP